MISVLILTKNEAADLPGALASVAWSDDVHVLDSESTDGTQEIARAAGAQVWMRVFDNFAAHRNFGLRLPFRHGWVLILDADERLTAELAAEMQRVVAEHDPNAADGPRGFRVRRAGFSVRGVAAACAAFALLHTDAAAGVLPVYAIGE